MSVASFVVNLSSSRYTGIFRAISNFSLNFSDNTAFMPIVLFIFFGYPRTIASTSCSFIIFSISSINLSYSSLCLIIVKLRAIIPSLSDIDIPSVFDPKSSPR